MSREKSITQQLSNLIHNTSFSLIPSETREKAKTCIIDTVGCALGALTEETNQQVLKRLVSISNANDPPSGQSHPGYAWGQDTFLQLLPGTLFNGILSHTLELDDVHRNSKVHAGAVVVPATLTLGRHLGSEGSQILRAVVLGYEVAHRIGQAIDMREHRSRGWHCTSTMGVFGAAVGAAVLLDLSEAEITSALGLAGTHASGLWTFLGNSATHKRFHTGKAAHDGLLAAELASAGLRGPSRILEGEDGGIFRAMGSFDQSKLVTDSWGTSFEIDEVSFKIYPACRSTHPVIEALLSLRSDYQLRLDQVDRVVIDTYRFAKMQCDHKSWPQSSQEAKFNFRYAVSVVLEDGEAGIRQFSTERLLDGRLRTRAPEVSVNIGDDFESRYPMEWGSKVSAFLTDGQVLTKTIRYPKGDPENPIRQDELKHKFLTLTQISKSENEARELLVKLESLEKVNDLRTVRL
jgi:2-methylcitrate dehydratase PrpD